MYIWQKNYQYTTFVCEREIIFFIGKEGRVLEVAVAYKEKQYIFPIVKSFT